MKENKKNIGIGTKAALGSKENPIYYKISLDEDTKNFLKDMIRNRPVNLKGVNPFKN